MQRERVTVTLDPGLVAQLDRIAELRGVSRSGLMERLLEVAVEEEERAISQLGSPVIGPLVQAVLDHPKLIASIARAIGERMSEEEVARLAAASSKVRATRERLRSKQGHRADLRPRGAS